MPSAARKNPPPDQRRARARARRESFDPRQGACGLGQNRSAHAPFSAAARRSGRPRPDRRHHFHQRCRCGDAPSHFLRARRCCRCNRRGEPDADPSSMESWRSVHWHARRPSAGISSICRRNCAFPPSIPFAASLRCSSRCSPASAAASISASSPGSSIAAPRAALSNRSTAAARSLRAAIETLLLWRDNSWQDLETQLVGMLGQRDRWMHGFVLDRDPDWDALRERLERPFAREVRGKLTDAEPSSSSRFLGRARKRRAGALCVRAERRQLHQELAELAEFPVAPFDSPEQLEEARQAFVCLQRIAAHRRRRLPQADRMSLTDFLKSAKPRKRD